MSLRALEAQLGAADPEERRRAAAALSEQEGEQRVSLLLRALGDADWRVRKEATTVAVGLAPALDVLGGLVDALRPGDNVGLRNAAVEAIGGFGAPAVDALSKALPKLDADGRKLAAEALAKSSQPSALKVLRTLLADADSNVR
ncbi:MAG TPA: HEAT repeat domain-containing protein, partial [Polyangiaceae bacterium]|nr:HEAT repeat domain-containing protein [Polyangiaceae bacterium]